MVSATGLQKLPKKFTLPINFPILASVGIHAVLFAMILPKWDFNNSKQQNIGFENTPVIELNPVEQSRLPNFNPSGGLGWNLPSQIPDVNSQIPTTEIPNGNSFQFPLVDNNMPNLPPLPSSYSNYVPDNSYNIPSSYTLPPPPPNFTNGDFPSPPSEGNFTDITSEEQANINRRDSLFPLSSQNPEIQTPRELINQRINSPELAEKPNNESNQQLATNFNPSQPSNYAQLTSLLQRDNTNLRGEDANKNDIAFRIQANTVNPERIDISGYYPKDACIGRLEGTAVYGVIVNSQGSITNNVQLIKSSGYPIFNQQGFRQIPYQNFPSNGNTQAYHVYVNFKPTDCPSLSLANLGQIPTSNQPNIVKPVVTNRKNQPPQPQVTSPVTNPVTPSPGINQVNQPSNPTTENNTQKPTPNNVNNKPPEPQVDNTPKPEANLPPKPESNTAKVETPPPQEKNPTPQLSSRPSRALTRQYNHLRRNNPSNSSLTRKVETPSISENVPKLEENNPNTPPPPAEEE